MKGVNTKICKNEEKSVRTVSGKVVRDIASTQRVHQSARQPHHTRERMNHKIVKECHIVACAMETLVNPTEDVTGSRITVTMQPLQSWRDVDMKLLQM